MEFRDLKKKYSLNSSKIDKAIVDVISKGTFIGGTAVDELEEKLSEYVGVKHCITCANGTDALQLALMAWGIGKSDAVFVPDFTFVSSGEVVSSVGAIPIFVDIDNKSYNINTVSLEKMIKKVIADGRLTPKVIIAVDLFGQPANYTEIRKIADKYNMFLLEDGAQGFGGRIDNKKACSFGDISTTSFFPAKPLGCYGDGGAVFTDNDEWSKLIRSLKIHGKGTNKYDNIRVGMNSRLDTIQAAVLLAKLPVFQNKELDNCNKFAEYYTDKLKNVVITPKVDNEFYSSWAQYTIQLENKEIRDGLQTFLKQNDIPSMVYYMKPMHKQLAFSNIAYDDSDYPNTNKLCDTVLSLPFHPYLDYKDMDVVTEKIKEYLGAF